MILRNSVLKYNWLGSLSMADSKKTQEEKVKSWRLLRIDEELRAGNRVNATTLAEKIGGVSSRTIQRDIEYMKLFHNAPIEWDEHNKTYYYTEANFFIKSIQLTEGELFSVALFDQLLELFPVNERQYQRNSDHDREYLRHRSEGDEYERHRIVLPQIVIQRCHDEEHREYVVPEEHLRIKEHQRCQQYQEQNPVADVHHLRYPVQIICGQYVEQDHHEHEHNGVYGEIMGEETRYGDE